jgi:hypothetical protein
LHASTALRERLVGEAHDVEPVDHYGDLAEHVGVGDGGAVALVRIDRHDLDACHPVGGLLGEPSLQSRCVATIADVNDLTGGDIDRRRDEPTTAMPLRG